MNSVELVKSICKQRKIPISKLEKDLGFANGYIGQLRKGTFPTNRLMQIAEYLSVSIEYLMTGEENTPTTTDGGYSSDLSPAFFRLKQGLEPYGISDSDVDFLLDVYKAHIKNNQ